MTGDAWAVLCWAVSFGLWNWWHALALAWVLKAALFAAALDAAGLPWWVS